MPRESASKASRAKATGLAEDEGPDTEWVLRLFFSVDLEGSTAFKATSQQRGDDHEWCVAFEEFYRDFPVKLQGALNVVLKEERYHLPEIDPVAAMPRLWKMNGDELLFRVEVRDSKHIVGYIAAFRDALNAYNDLLKKDRAHHLRCKGTAWIAGFPVGNVKVAVDSPTGTEGTEPRRWDFIGPQIDSGFRITKFASGTRLAVSVDLLLMLATHLKGLSVEVVKSLTIRYEGKHELKGVLNGAPYPIFWIDCRSACDEEDKWLGRNRECDPGEVITFCESFIDGHQRTRVRGTRVRGTRVRGTRSETAERPVLLRPFIAGDPSGKFAVIPADFAGRKDQALDDRDARRQDGERPPKGIGSGDSGRFSGMKKFTVIKRSR